MNGSDFRKWMAYHAAANPTWAKQASSANATTIEAWSSLMVGISLEHAKRATDDMASGAISRPYAVEDHITAIAKRSRDIGSAVIRQRDSREKTYLCSLCLDSSFVTILHPRSVRMAQNGEYDHFVEWVTGGKIGRQPAMKGFTCASSWCRCRLAESNRDWEVSTPTRDPKRPVPRPMRVYDKAQDVIWETSFDKMAEMIERAKTIKPPNHVEEFDNWNSSDFDEGGLTTTQRTYSQESLYGEE